jgi:hypothetical protein
MLIWNLKSEAGVGCVSKMWQKIMVFYCMLIVYLGHRTGIVMLTAFLYQILNISKNLDEMCHI